jgi:16S rRNA (cytosine1402-N4)-methyltransferase
MLDFHEPVMLSEILEYLNPQSGQTVVDCTLGGGAHAVEIVKRLLPSGKLIGIDRDSDALNKATERLMPYRDNVILEKGNFSEVEGIVRKHGITCIDGMLADLGVSSYQLETPERGFSFRFDAPLDMRMDSSQSVTADELVNSLSEKELEDTIATFGEERWARRIAKFIVLARAKTPIRKTGQLVDVIRAAVPAGARQQKIHFATRTFQALRIAVNDELGSLECGVNAGISLLSSGGRICVISYHSLEDRAIKGIFRTQAGRCTCQPSQPFCNCGAERRVKIITKRPVTPTEAEVEENPRSRSAKLRVAEKLSAVSTHGER